MINEQRSAADDTRIAIHESGHAANGRGLHALRLGGATVEPGPDFGGLCWGAGHDRRLEFTENYVEGPDLCAALAGEMPAIGESRAAFADVFLHCWNMLIDTVSGTEAERLFVEGSPWFASSDEMKAAKYAALITSSPAAAEALILAARIEAAALLEKSSHVVKALAAELISQRTLDGEQIDAVIEAAVAAKALELKTQSRAEWQRCEASSAAFLKGLAT